MGAPRLFAHEKDLAQAARIFRNFSSSCFYTYKCHMKTLPFNYKPIIDKIDTPSYLNQARRNIPPPPQKKEIVTQRRVTLLLVWYIFYNLAQSQLVDVIV